jgi:tetratricopeptide (TPR) repeat protein
MKKISVLSIVLLVLICMNVVCGGEIPSISQAYYDRGIARFLLEEDYMKAIDDFTTAIEFLPSDPDLYIARGLVYLKIGKNGEAESDFKKAISLNSELENVLTPLLSETGNWQFIHESPFNGDNFYVDRTSVKKSGDILSFTLRGELSGGSCIIQEKLYDCRKKEVRGQNFPLFRDVGESNFVRYKKVEKFFFYPLTYWDSVANDPLYNKISEKYCR